MTIHNHQSLCHMVQQIILLLLVTPTLQPIIKDFKYLFTKKTPTMPSLKTIKTKIKSTGNLKIAHDQNKSITKKSFISMYLSSIQKNK